MSNEFGPLFVIAPIAVAYAGLAAGGVNSLASGAAR